MEPRDDADDRDRRQVRWDAGTPWEGEGMENTPGPPADPNIFRDAEDEDFPPDP